MLSGVDFDSEEFRDVSLADDSVSDCTFTSCTFMGCVFERCTFTNVKIIDCVFQNCRIISNKFVKSSSRGVIMDGCSIIGVIFKLLSPSGFGTPFDTAIGCTMKYCLFEKIDMPKVSFRGSDLLECSFTECKLTGCNFSGCSLAGTEFAFSDLCQADFRSSRGYIINLNNCKAKGALFSYPEAIHLLDAFGVKIQ